MNRFASKEAPVALLVYRGSIFGFHTREGRKRAIGQREESEGRGKARRRSPLVLRRLLSSSLASFTGNAASVVFSRGTSGPKMSTVLRYCASFTDADGCCPMPLRDAEVRERRNDTAVLHSTPASDVILCDGVRF